MTQTDCELIILSLHDARATCACGGWHYSFTGERKAEQVKARYIEHVAMINRLTRKDTP